MDIPVYLFVGFLESGKTKFIQSTLEDERFNSGEKTLLLVCEEGLEEYEPNNFSGQNVYFELLEDEQRLSEDYFRALYKKYRFERVVIEYNGMWQLSSLYEALPENYPIYQCMMFADANTILQYNANMRNIVVDKINACEVVVFNRCKQGFEKMPLHKLVRNVSRRPDIAYEYPDGSVEYDEIEDPLPFDINAPLIRIDDKDFALFYRDMIEDMTKYEGKTVKFKGIVAKDRKMPDNTFAIGRHVMTCCIEDITYAGLVAVQSGNVPVKSRDWFVITATVKCEKNKLYRSKGPVLYVSEMVPSNAPEQEVATFY